MSRIIFEKLRKILFNIQKARVRHPSKFDIEKFSLELDDELEKVREFISISQGTDIAAPLGITVRDRDGRKLGASLPNSLNREP